MPTKAKQPCHHGGCHTLTTEAYCPQHKTQHAKEVDSRRGSAAKRGYDRRWQKARAVWLRHHPLCVECERQGRLTSATVVDHITPHRGDQGLFWDFDNWQSLCKPCHDRKTFSGG